MPSKHSRRFFLGAAGAAAAASGRAPALPVRQFGNTGERLPVLAIGCGNRLWAAYRTKERGLEALELALDSGIRYFDTAQSYGDGTSESWVGEATWRRRDEVFLATKTQARTYDEVLARAEASLERLRTDRLDVLHIHSLRYEDDLERIETGRAIEALQRLREEKAVRYIGITSHADPETLATALSRHDLDCTQMALNAGLQGRSPDGAGYWKRGGVSDIFGEPLPPRPFPGESFEDIALPVAVKKGLGIVGMKVTAQEGLLGQGPDRASAESLIRYVLSLPVSVVTVGMPDLQMIRENAALVRSFEPMAAEEMRDMSDRLAGAHKASLDHHFCDGHVDA
ncbi:MAG: aldo/keto reductase [Bryobacterales bacterium]|nr:aldo/keto reductase [Bryobacterales bacterium]